MKVGDKVRVANEFDNYYGRTGIVVEVERGMIPDVTVLLDANHDSKQGRLYRFFFGSQLEVINETLGR